MINGKSVAIDARMIEMSGIGTYVQHLMGQGIYDYALGTEETIRKYDDEVVVIPYDAPIYSLKEQLLFPNKDVKRAGISLIHFPHYNVPASYSGRFLATIHDMTHIILPEMFGNRMLGNRLKSCYAHFLMKHAVRNAMHIFTVSQNSKKDICETFGICQDRVTITYNAASREFVSKDRAETEYLYARFSIPRNKKILLYVGNLKAHKNLSRLLEAFSKINDDKRMVLLLVGKAFSGHELKGREEELKIEGEVIHTGVVQKEELVDLYNLADVFVFPSLYEGFGIPLLEAMACGTPVVCSNSSSIPEVAGDAAMMFDPYDAEEMGKAIKDMLDMDAAEYIARGRERAGRFAWGDAVASVKKEIVRCLGEI